jgi:TolB-like protein
MRWLFVIARNSSFTDDVKNPSQIWAVARVLVKLALQDDQPSQR